MRGIGVRSKRRDADCGVLAEPGQFRWIDNQECAHRAVLLHRVSILSGCPFGSVIPFGATSLRFAGYHIATLKYR